MTIVTTATSSGPYAATADTTFAVAFQSAGVDEIEITLDDVVVDTSLYTFTRDTDGTGEVVFASAVTGEVMIYSNPDFDQQTSFSRFGAFFPDQINGPLDKAAAKSLYLKDRIDTLYPSRVVAERAGGFLAWDGSGDPVVSSGTGADAGLRADLAAPNGYTLIGGISVLNFSTISEGATAAANRITLNAEIAALSAAGGGSLHIPPGVYPMTGQILLKTGVRIFARGAFFDGVGIYLYTPPGGNTTDWTIERLTIDTDVTENFGYRLFDIANFEMLGMRMNRDGDGGYSGMLIGASHGLMDDYRSTGSNGIWIEGNTLTFHAGDMTSADSGDDCLVIKAPNTLGSGDDERTNSSYDINISDWTANGFAAAVSLGSEIGRFNTNDATYANRISNVNMSNIVARNCQYGLFVKPGANDTNSYRDGTVESFGLRGLVMEDLLGTAFVGAVLVWAGRGGRVRNGLISNVTVNARALDQGQTNAGVELRVYDYAGGTAASSIADLTFDKINIVDAWGGVANGVGGAPGHPIDNTIRVEKSTGGPGTPGVFGNIQFKNIFGNGTRRSGIEIGTGIDDKLVFDGIELRNTCVGLVSAADGGIISESRIRLKNIIGITTDVARRQIGYASQTARNYIGERAHLHVGTAGATVDQRAGIFRPEVDAYITNIALVDAAGITQSDVDYASFEFRNMGNNNVLASCTTQTTGGRNFTQDAAVNVTANLIVDADAFVAKDAVVRFLKTHTGAGKAITEMRAFIDFIPYGRS